MITKVDTFMLAWVQKRADNFSELTGLTKFWLEKWFFIISSVTLVSFFILYSISNDRDFPYIWVTLLFIWTSLGVWGIESREEAFLSSGMLQFTAESQPRIRIPFLVFIAVPIILISLIEALSSRGFVFLLTLSQLLSMVALYLTACTPKPPQKSKLRKWYEKALLFINDALTPVPIRR